MNYQQTKSNKKHWLLKTIDDIVYHNNETVTNSSLVVYEEYL